MSKVLVTGARGFLGARVAAFLSERHEVAACAHADLDITSREQVMDFFRDWRPDYVIHCAAISDTGYAQQHPEESEQVNVEGTLNMACACAAAGAKLVYMSSDQVYNGVRHLGGLPETSASFPVTTYGQHKLKAELLATAVLPTAVGLRLSWMYDLPGSPYKLNRNLLVNLLQAAESQTPLLAAVHEYRGITWVWEVVQRMEACWELPGGVYNFGCENDENSYETFVAAARLLKLPFPEELVRKDEVRFVEQERNLSMSLAQLRKFGMDFPDTQTGLAQALQSGQVG